MERPSLKYWWLKRDIRIPKSMCKTPKMMDIFILIELVNVSSVFVPCQMGSNPNTYTSSCLSISA